MGEQMTTQVLYLLDRNVISIIKDTSKGVEQHDLNKIAMLNMLREIDLPSVSITPLLSLIEGQKGREESFEEKLNCLNKETSVIKSFFAHANTDTSILQSNAHNFSLAFTEYREEGWETHETFLRAAYNLILNKVAKRNQKAIKNQILDLANHYKIYLGHIVVIACLSCLYGNDHSRGVLKPTKSSTFNTLSDLYVFTRINMIKAVAQQQQMTKLRTIFLTMDENLKHFLDGIHTHNVQLTEHGVNQKVEYKKILFPELSESEYIELLNELYL